MKQAEGCYCYNIIGMCSPCRRINPPPPSELDSLKAENERLREAIEAALSSIRWSRVQDKTENRNNCILSAETVLNDAITTHKSGAV